MSKFSLAAFEKAARGHAQSRGSTATRPQYEAVLDQWLAWCEENDLDPTRPALHHASAFRDELVAASAASTVRRKLASLSAMYDAALDQEKPLASWNPFKKKVVRPPADDYGVTEVLSADEVGRLIATAIEAGVKGLCDATVMEVLYGTGMRISEALSLKRAQLVQRGEQLVFCNVKVKKRGRVDVAVTTRIAEALARWLAAAPASDYVFPSPNPRRFMSRKTFNRRLNAYAKAAGVKKAHPHRLRSAFATSALDAGVPLHEVQAAMHHASPATTQRYDRGVRGTGVAAAVAEFRRKQAEEE